MQFRKNSKTPKNITHEPNKHSSHSLSKLVAGKKLIPPKITSSDLKPKLTLHISLLTNDG